MTACRPAALSDTRVLWPGTWCGEHMPMTAKELDRTTLIRPSSRTSNGVKGKRGSGTGGHPPPPCKMRPSSGRVMSGRNIWRIEGRSVIIAIPLPLGWGWDPLLLPDKGGRAPVESLTRRCRRRMLRGRTTVSRAEMAGGEHGADGPVPLQLCPCPWNYLDDKEPGVEGYFPFEGT